MKKVVVMVVVALAFAANGFAFGSKFKDEVEKEQGAVKLVREVMRGGYDIITTSELNDLLQAGDDLLVIDTMPFEASYQKGHIPTAKQFLFPIPEMDKWDKEQTGGKSAEDFAALLGPDKNKKIVIYCGFVKCTRSHNGALWAKKLGYTNVFRHPGGIYAWKGAGYDVVAE
ncbi:rhodanese-like domain-containing protein [Desulforhopalus singaporensis]|uniref:Rhodanese-related sulfurtransferase n=1 Tax=Desulforhopalus singaporensis TaxID=91360 RepID=A0A1H0K2Q9_9BACT|nr:rhodanese-like domain-containing protein [Desulforhopalus singaporensis]SDO50013.1 Rhodanese-related sulfurtransferase [Desulforhopalus singaporensis]